MSISDVTAVEAGPGTVSRRVTVHAPVAELFALVANPHKHHQLDGSGTLRDVDVIGPVRLWQGAKFTVGMKRCGVPYKITSRVTAFEDDRIIEWQHPMGHKWRWEFAAAGAGETEVTESFVYDTALFPKVLELLKQPQANAQGISSTLEQLAQRFA